MDDWDFVHQLLAEGWWTFVFTPQVTGHLMPVFKLVYASLLTTHGYDLGGVLLFQYGLRLCMLGALLAILWRLRALRVPSLLVCLSVICNEVGVRDVFFWATELGHEMAVASFSFAILLLLRFADTGRISYAVLGAGAGLAGAFSFGSGLAGVVTLALVWIARPPHAERGLRDRPAIATKLLLSVAAVACAAYAVASPQRIPASAGSVERLWGMLTFFWTGAFLNPSLNGLLAGSLPGAATVAASFALYAGAAVAIAREPDRARRFVIAAFAVNSLTVQALLAVTRWEHGSLFASSYRYNYNNVAFQLPILAVLFSCAIDHAGARVRNLARVTATVAAAGIFGLGVIGAVRGGQDLGEDHRSRRECIAILLETGDDPGCGIRLYNEYHRPEFVREVYRLIQTSPGGGQPERGAGRD
jgi:hypothetical protein